MASAAEARIRDKAERLLREQWPDARIVHEFEVNGARLDLAAVTPERLVLVEIKSELDTLTRLDRQVKIAKTIGGPVLCCFAPRWRDAVRHSGLYGVEWLEETDEGFSGLARGRMDARHDRYNSRRLMDLLLKPELFMLAKPLGAKARQTVPELACLVHENLTGGQIRRGALLALRQRKFGWTCDAPTTGGGE